MSECNQFNYLCKECIRENNYLFYINRAGYSDVDATFNIERDNSYPYCTIHYVEEGTGTVIIRGKRYPVCKGKLFVLNAYESHQYMSDPEQTFTLRWIEFAGGDSVDMIRRFLGFHFPVVKAPASTKINKYLIRVQALLKKDPVKYSVPISKIIYSILLVLMDTYDDDCEEICGYSVVVLNLLTNYMDDHLNENLTNEKITAITNYNAEYFSKIFRKVTGITPAKYMLQKKIIKAKELLIADSIKVDNLAADLGFCNTSHFIRQFKKYEGVTPKEFRSQNKAYMRKD